MKPKLAKLLIVLTAMAIYAPTLLHPFVWDDHTFIVNNLAVHKIDVVKNFTDRTTFASNPDYHHTAYRPLRTLVNGVLYNLFGAEPFYFRLLNLILHAGVGLLVFQLAQQLGASLLTALFAALLFAVHPIHTESVTWISSMNDPLFTLLYLLALTVFIRAKRPNDLIWVPLLFVGALLSKEMAITLPFCLALYLMLVAPSKGRFRRAQWSCIGVNGVLALAYFFWRHHVLGSFSQEPFSAAQLAQSLLKLPWTMTEYLRMLVVPYPQLAFYPPLGNFALFSAQFIVPALILGSVIIVSTLLVRGHRKYEYLLLALPITLLPVANLLPMWVEIAERFNYLASVFFCILLGVMSHEFLKARAQVSSKRVWLSAVTVLMVLFSTLTMVRNTVWRSDLALAQDNIDKAPMHSAAHWNLGTVALREGDYPRAVAAFTRYLELDRPRPDVLTNLAAAYLGMKEWQKALSPAQAALTFDPKNGYYWMNVGLALKGLGDYSAALHAMNQAVRLSPSYQTYYNRGLLYERLGKMTLARANLQLANQYKSPEPGYTAHME